MFFVDAVLQQAPAETTNYMIAGFAVVFIVIFLYLLSIYLRTKKQMRDYEILREIELEK